MGHLSPLDGIGPDKLGIPELAQRLAKKTITEVILATNPTVEGEATAHYISDLVKQHPEIKFIFAPHEIDAENLAFVKKEFPGSVFYSEWISAIMEAEMRGLPTPSVCWVPDGEPSSCRWTC